jgi:pimeloyl-ACP methyl ester carboxylesterase
LLINSFLSIAIKRTFAGRAFASLAAILACLGLLLCACGPRRTPNLARIFANAREQKGKRPIVVIPGILGSQLVNSKTREIVWPSAFRSDEDGLSLPVSPDLAANRDDLQPSKIVESLKLARITEVFIYHELLRALQNFGGYQERDWSNPGPDGDHDSFYVFAYDWRLDNVTNAQNLIAKIEALKATLNRPDLRFNIIGHSMGGLIARYAAEYGASDLPPEGVEPVRTWDGAKHINRILMFGTPNEGSADAFATLMEGYSITEGLRTRVRLLNKLGREDAVTAPSVFQLLPHVSTVRFLDENLKPIDIDLYDAATWRKYGWTAINDPAYRLRFVNGKTNGDDRPFKGGSLKALDAYLEAVLKRAKRFHEALDAPTVGESPVTLFAFGGDCEETLDAPIILRDNAKNRWITLTAPRSFRTSIGARVSRSEATAAMFVPGDGRVTRGSLLAQSLRSQRQGLSLFNAGLPIAYAVFACDLHGELQNNPTLQDGALTALVSEIVK